MRTNKQILDVLNLRNRNLVQTNFCLKNHVLESIEEDTQES